MKYYIIADGGGTKLHAILHDENFRVLSEVTTAGTNANFKSKKQVEDDVNGLARTLILPETRKIEACDVCIVGDCRLLEDALAKHCDIKSFASYGEGVAALAASGERYGAVAQAGTGSDAFLIQPDYHDTVGGWGPLLGDEGSGYDIGIKSLKAAVYASDGRGETTVMLDMLMKKWELKRPWDMIFKLSDNPEYRSLAASVSYITAQAAALGDKVALDIFANAAHELSHQMLTLIKRHGGSFTGTMVASGGAWKGSPVMLQTYASDIRAVFPDIAVSRPVFEPVVGLAALRRFEDGCEKDGFFEKMKDGFKKFLTVR